MIQVNYDKNIKYHSYYNNELWASQGSSIIVSTDYGRTWKEKFKIPNLSTINKFSIFNRLTRGGVHNIININITTQLISIKKKLLLYKNNTLIKEFSIDRGNRPIRMGITLVGNNIYYGDYWNNTERVPANIYKINLDTLEKEVLLSIDGVRHIHFVISKWDNNQVIYIGTGDYDSESKILEYNVVSHELREIGSGDQSWRAVSLLEDKRYLYWGTDAPDEQNYIYRYDKVTKMKEPIIKVDGPIFYSAKNRENILLFASTVEYKNIHTAKIYSISENGDSKEICTFEKDFLPQYLFGFGVVDFISGQELLSTIYINKHGLK